MRGFWPPSKPGRLLEPVRDICPLVPRPAVLPWPAAMPRPTRFGTLFLLICSSWYFIFLRLCFLFRRGGLFGLGFFGWCFGGFRGGRFLFAAASYPLAGGNQRLQCGDSRVRGVGLVVRTE